VWLWLAQQGLDAWWPEEEGPVPPRRAGWWRGERRLTAGAAAASFVTAAGAEQDARVRSEATITILAFNMVFWMFSEVALIGAW